ncbi:MAG: tetraacyldisaccharide 4'-kinase [Bacteroidales bacterium]|nr:tetraacyldisaccharide 4'-kinase [Bacteroidales bacterium]
MNLRILLYPFGLIYGAVAALRRWTYRCGLRKAYQAPIPTIGVGNLSVGGTGKTPHVEYLIRLLSNQYKIATLSRGYKRKTKGFVLANDIDPQELSAEMIGDEPLQFFTKFPHIKVAVDEKRKDGIQQLMQRFPDLQYIILDDCYQHLQVKPNLNILITEYAAPYALDYPLPAGRLREFRSAARYANMVIVSKCPETLTEQQRAEMTKLLKLQDYQQLFFTTMRYGKLTALNDCGKLQEVSPQTEVVLLTAIAHPEPMVAYLSEKFKIIHHYRFADHHYFSTEEIAEIKKTYFSENNQNRILVTTEKDSMRLIYGVLSKHLEAIPLFSLPIVPYFLFQDEEFFPLLFPLMEK